jgi:hypothetical protein
MKTSLTSVRFKISSWYVPPLAAIYTQIKLMTNFKRRDSSQWKDINLLHNFESCNKAYFVIMQQMRTKNLFFLILDFSSYRWNENAKIIYPPFTVYQLCALSQYMTRIHSFPLTLTSYRRCLSACDDEQRLKWKKKKISSEGNNIKRRVGDAEAGACRGVAPCEIFFIL